MFLFKGGQFYKWFRWVTLTISQITNSSSNKQWDVNVQCYSGCPAVFAILTALAGPNGRVMGLHYHSGGHPIWNDLTWI